MINSLFGSFSRVLVLILFLIGFSRLTILPDFFSNTNNSRLAIIVILLVFLSFGSQKNFCKKNANNFFDIMMACLALFIVINCFSCYYYRNQSPLETFRNWAPILILYVYYPFSKINLKISSWEKVLFFLFIYITFAHLIQTIDPTIGLFPNDTSDVIFEHHLRVRLFSDAILFLGSIYSFNKYLTCNETKRMVYFLMFCLSALLIFLMGFRTVIFALLLVCFIIYAKITKQKLKTVIITTCICIPLAIYLTSLPIVQERYNEIVERNNEQNFGKSDYIRVLLLNYYFTEYFKSKSEMFWGSGMVERLVSEKKSHYRSSYSKFVSLNSMRFGYYPVDMGIIGFSWEGGVPAAIIMLLLCLKLAIHKQEDKYLYIQAWGAFTFLISFTTPFYFYHFNLIYTVIVWVIFSKVTNKSYLVNCIDHIKNATKTK